MKELPILFSTDMVEAILENRKTMTRRTAGIHLVNDDPDKWIYDGQIKPQFSFKHTEFGFITTSKPRYQVGDKIWVRERFETDTDGTVKFYANNIEVKHNKAYRDLTKWTPSIFLKKIDARLWLEVTGVRCERLQSICDNDIKFEGTPNWNHHKDLELISFTKYWEVQYSTKQKQFFMLWIKINGIASLDLNPWVFIYDFKRIEKP